MSQAERCQRLLVRTALAALAALATAMASKAEEKGPLLDDERIAVEFVFPTAPDDKESQMHRRSGHHYGHPFFVARRT